MLACSLHRGDDPFGSCAAMRGILCSMLDLRLCVPLRGFSLGLAFFVAAACFGHADSLLGGLQWRLAGPFRGGRALAVAGVPGAPETFYFGSVGGGVWKTENAGRTWAPLFDKEADASIGAIAVAPSDPSIIYVGAGEADMRNDIQHGHGVYRSADAGKTWTHLGLDDTRQIGKILVDPGDPDIVYVAALGHAYGPNEQRGVFKSTDGGKRWVRTLFKNPDTGAIDLAMDPKDSNVIFASMWQTRRPPWSIYPPSNGPGGGLYRSTDAGMTWSQVNGGGFPAFVGHVGVTISPADSDRVYACVDTNNLKDGGVYRSDDGGVKWKLVNGDGRLWTRGWYFCGITADPKLKDVVYVNNTSSYRSLDGGKTFKAFKGAPGGDDNHALWINPDDSTHMILGTDQGVVVSVDGGSTWSSWYNQPIGQFYHVVTDNRFPYWIYGAQQDSGAMAIPSRTIHTGISALYQRPIDAGGESGTIAPDPLHPGLLFSSGGSKEQFETGWEQSIDPTLGDIDTNWRSEWTQPIVISPVNPKVVYTSHQKIFRTDDGGSTWRTISPDLTRQKNLDPPLLDSSTKADHDGQARRGVVYWIAPSPIRPHQIWAGTDDGLIWVTRDEGAHWQDVTPPEMGAWSKVGIIEASHFNADSAYAAIDKHRIDDDRPYIYRTRDGGKHWIPITKGIPPNQFVNVVREDPKRQGLLYAGTDWGIYYSLDDGGHWQTLQLNLPAASVRDIAFGDSDLIVATHGRAIWILDDASLLRQISSSATKTALFRPSTAMIFQRPGTFGFGLFDEGTPLPPEEPQGENAPWGAVIDYSLAASAPSVKFTITDSQNKTVRVLSSLDKLQKIDVDHLDIPAYWVHPASPLSSKAGGHRFLWNFRYHDDAGPTVPPGAYTIRMDVGQKSLSQPLTVVMDPRVNVTTAQLRAQFKFTQVVADEIEVVKVLRTKVEAKLKKALSGAERKRLSGILGGGGSGTPDEGGTAPTDFGSLRRVLDGLEGVRGAVQSAPAAPTIGEITAFRSLRARADAIAKSF